MKQTLPMSLAKNICINITFSYLAELVQENHSNQVHPHTKKSPIPLDSQIKVWSPPMLEMVEWPSARHIKCQHCVQQHMLTKLGHLMCSHYCHRKKCTFSIVNQVFQPMTNSYKQYVEILRKKKCLFKKVE